MKNLTDQDLCNFLNSNLVLVARHFQYKVEVLFEETVLYEPLGKK